MAIAPFLARALRATPARVEAANQRSRTDQCVRRSELFVVGRARTASKLCGPATEPVTSEGVKKLHLPLDPAGDIGRWIPVAFEMLHYGRISEWIDGMVGVQSELLIRRS